MIDRWVSFWDRREAPTSLSFTRISFGAVVLVDLLHAWSANVVPALWIAPPGGMSPLLPSQGVSTFGATVLVAAAAASAFLFTIGALYRAAGIALSFALAIMHRFQPTGDGADLLMRIVVPILALSSANARWSVDAWLRSRRKLPPQTDIPAWPRYLLILQLLWVYTSSAQCRDDVAWWPWGGFAAISNVLEDPHFARFTPKLLATAYPLTQAATLATMLFELSAPFALVWALRDPSRPIPKIAVAWTATGMALHLGIALTMQIGVFPFAMIALYPVLFHPARIEAALAAACP